MVKIQQGPNVHRFQISNCPGGERGILKRDKWGLHQCSAGNVQKSSFCYFLPYIIFCMYTHDTYSYAYGKYHYSIKKSLQGTNLQRARNQNKESVYYI